MNNPKPESPVELVRAIREHLQCGPCVPEKDSYVLSEKEAVKRVIDWGIRFMAVAVKTASDK